MSLTFNSNYEPAFADITTDKPDADNNIEYGKYNAIEQHIKRGSSIRKKKPQNYPREREYNPIRNIIKLKRKKKKSFSRYRTHCRNGNHFFSGFGASDVHIHMKSTINSAKRLNKRLNRTNNKYRNCPMRIAELATPNKRRCLETWKEKCKVLPDFIVERFKNYVMDQKPVVQIPEAIYCFKKSKTSDRSGKKKKLKNIKKCSQTMETKTLSIIFGHKIAQQLNKPILVKLNSRFTTLSEVVGDDIASLMHTRTCSSNNRLSLITEMANKITHWMALILEDSSLKLLEDTLENLEDEEGPVFDCIDDLLENVLDICEPHFEYSDRYNSKSDSSSQSESFDENTSTKEFNEINSVKNLEHEESEQDTNRYKQENEEETMNSTENYITNQLNDVISFSIATSEEQNKNEHQLFNENLNTSKSQTLQNEFNRESEFANVIDSNSTNSNDSKIVDPKVISSISKQEETEEQSNKNIDILEAQDEEEAKEIEHEMQRADSVIANEDLNLIVDPLENDNFVEKNNSNIMLPDENVANTEFSQDIVETIEDIVDTEEKNNPDSEEIDYDIPEDIILNTYNTEENKSEENHEYNIQDVIHKTEENERNEKDDIQVPKDLNLTELYEVPSEDIRTEEIADDKNKKVKFSSTEMVTQETLQSKRMDTDLSENNFKYEQDKIIPQPSIDIIKSTISFSAPNEELLSDVDELWPKDISSPIMRPSESVSRSVTSLGRIMESDEKVLISPDSVTDTILEESVELLAQSHSEEITNASESVENNNNTFKEISNGSEFVKKNNNTLKEISNGSEFVAKNNNTLKEISNDSEFVAKNNNTLKEISNGSEFVEKNNNTLKEISNGSEFVEKHNNTLKEISNGSEFVEKNNNTVIEILNGLESVEKNSNALKEISTQSDIIFNEVVVIPQITSVEIPSPYRDKHKMENKESNNKKETSEKLKEKVKAKKDQTKTDRIPYNKKFQNSYKSPSPNVVVKIKPLQKAVVANTYKSGTTKETLQQSTNKNSRKNNMKHISGLNAVQIDTKLSMQVYSEKGITKENISTYYEQSKPDYKVKLNTAPKWINRNNKRGCSKKKSIADYYARKWCDDLYNGFEHLEIWRDWIIIISELILTRKRDRPNKVSIDNTIRYLNEWINLKRNIDSEAYLWRRLNRHTKKKLRHIIYVSKKESEVIPTVCCSKCCW